MQGVQAQTVSNFYLAFANDLVIVPVLNKVWSFPLFANILPKHAQ